MTILLYHGVAPQLRQGIYNYRGKFIAPAHFEAQLRYFSKHYSFVELDKGIRQLGEGTLPPYALAITFDDGYHNFYTYAYPILKRMRIPATMFVATDFVLEKKPLWVDRLEYAIGKQSGSYAEKIKIDARIREELKRLPEGARESRSQEIESSTNVMFSDFKGDRAVYAPLSEEEIGEMQKNGIVFGAHTKSHPILSRLDTKRIEEEILGSKEIFETRLGTISPVFAYPNGQHGDWNEAVENTVAVSGFVAALTTIEGVNTRKTHPLRLRRMVMDGTDDGFAFAAIASGVRLWLKTAKAYV